MKRYELSLLFSFVLHTLATRSSAERITLNANLKKPIAVTDEKFLSLTIDPGTLLAGNALSGDFERSVNLTKVTSPGGDFERSVNLTKVTSPGADFERNVNLAKATSPGGDFERSENLTKVTSPGGDFERSVNLAKAMSPGYVRLGGPQTSLRYFADQDSEGAEEKRGISMSESDWVLTHQWAEKAGLDVIACISPDNRQRKFEKSEDATEIISFSDHMGFNANWQLGYECQTKCNLSAGDLAKQTLHLRKVLNEFPRYSSSVITGPDVLIYNSEKQRKYLRDYFDTAAPALSAITWHPNFASVTLDDDGAYVPRDTLEEDKEELLKVVGRFIDDRPLWIAESRPEACKDLFIGALVLTRRLGNAARANVKVVMRQPTTLARPTPDYWVSLLHKTLVGREVFDASSEISKEKHVYLYCHCAKASNGSIVIFGMNLSPEDARINFKTPNVTTAHEYILSPGFDAPNRMFAETVFFNDKLLTLINHTIPDIYPEVLTHPNGLDLRLRSGDIGFWVIPDANVNSCTKSAGASKERMRVPRKLEEDAKARVTRRSAQEEGRRRQRSLGLIERELKKLKKFVRKQLEDYESRSLLSIGGLSSPEDANSKDSPRPRDDLQNRLEEFKDRLTRFADSAESNGARWRKSISELAANVVPLVLKVQTDLETVKEESNYENRMKSSSSVKETLKTLYELLARTNLNESIESKEDEVNRGSKRTKRDLLGEIEQPLNSERESLSRKPSEDDNVKGVRGSRRMKWWQNIRKMQPTVVELDGSEIGGNVFNADSGQDFPKGDVFFVASDPRRSGDYEYTKDIDGNGRKRPSELGYVDVDDAWADDVNDYPFYEPVGHFGSSRSWNNGMRLNSESPDRGWQARTYGSRKNDRFNNEKEFKIAGIRTDAKPEIQDDKSSSRRLDGYYETGSFLKNHRPTYRTFMPDESVGSGLSRQPSVERINYDNWKASGYGLSSPLKGLDFSIGTDYHDSRRPKRGNTDLRAILDREMINEDDANSKDCNCRVIRESKTCNCRSKRDAIESMESRADAGIVPDEKVIADLNKDIAHSNLRDDTDVEIFAKLEDSRVEKLELESSSPKIIQSTEQPLGTRANSEDLGKDPRGMKRAEKRFESNIPTLESRSDYQSEVQPTNLPSTLNSGEPASSGRTSMTSIKRVENNSFLDESEREQEEGIINSTQHAWTNRENGENSTPFVGEKLTDERRQGAEEAEEAEEASRTESSSATVKMATLSEGTIKKEFENSYDNAATVSSKRETKLEQVPHKRPVETKVAKPARSSGARKRSKDRVHVAKPQDPEILKRLRTLTALKDLLRKYNEPRNAGVARKPKAANRTEEYRRNRAEQVRKLRDKLHHKRETLLQECERNVSDMVGEETSTETRNPKRREAWEAIKESEDFRDMLNREKLAYVLMYQPSKYDAKREVDASDEMTERVQVPITEIVRVKSVRERVFDPDIQRKHRDTTIIEHPDPSRLREKIVRLTNLYQDQVTKRSNDRGDRSYFALVEDVERPRIFYYEPSLENEPRRNMRAASPRSLFHGTGYNQPRRKPYRESLKAAQYSGEEDQEESDELPEGKEIYIIDPSEYKGGDPHLRLYRGPMRSGINPKIASKSTYEATWGPVSYRPYRIRQTLQRKREGRVPSRDSMGLTENTGKLLQILVDNLDSHSAEELLKKLTGHSAESDEEGNLSSSIGEIKEEPEVSRDEELEEISGSKEDPDTSESSDTRGSEEQRESYRDATIEEETETEEDNISEALIPRENTTNNANPKEDSEEIEAQHVRKRKDTSAGSKEEYLGSLASFSLRKPPGLIEKTEANNYLRFEQSPEAISGENPSELLKPYDETAASLKEQIRSTSRSEHGKTFNPKFVIPSTSMSPGSFAPDGVEYPSIQANPDAKDPHRESTENYQDAPSSTEKGEPPDDGPSDRRDESVPDTRELYNRDEERGERGKRSNKNVNFEEVFNEPETLMTLPWARRSSRLRREAEDEEKIGEYGNANELQASDMQHLDEPSSPKILDDVERSLMRKISREKFATKEKTRKDEKDEDGFSGLLERNIPKLGNVVLDSLEKAENFSESVAQLIENIDENYNETLGENGGRNFTDTSDRSISPTQNIFRSTITNVKKFFVLLSGITNLLRG